MAFLICFAFLLNWTVLSFAFPHNTIDHFLKGSKVEFESSGNGPHETIRGTVKVVQLDPLTLARSGLFRRGLSPRRTPSLGSRLPFPAFLSQGRTGLAPKAPKVPVSPLHYLNPREPMEMDLKKRQGLQMWQRVMNKEDHGKMVVSLPVNLKDTKQTCTAVPFTQQVTAEGCDAVMVHNKLCFGHCSSLFVPSGGEFSGLGVETRAHRRAPCSRCAPSKAQTVTVPLRCGTEAREKRVMVVEECKCETGREEKNAEATRL
ncbi:hypothetical protein LDENG_00032550 [Lucifuga dentata]|nr:hypothetical protein LDENG_00032550 [Lucifuga dentata]